MKKAVLDTYIGKFVTIKLFDGDIFTGYLQKTHDEKFKNNPDLYLRQNYYFVTGNNDCMVTVSSLFRSSHVIHIETNNSEKKESMV